MVRRLKDCKTQTCRQRFKKAKKEGKITGAAPQLAALGTPPALAGGISGAPIDPPLAFAGGSSSFNEAGGGKKGRQPGGRLGLAPSPTRTGQTAGGFASKVFGKDTRSMVIRAINYAIAAGLGFWLWGWIGALILVGITFGVFAYLGK